MILEKPDPPHIPPSTVYVEFLDIQRQARLQLPNDLTEAEAERLIAVIRRAVENPS